jgi:hypothetical protein
MKILLLSKENEQFLLENNIVLKSSKSSNALVEIGDKTFRLPIKSLIMIDEKTDSKDYVIIPNNNLITFSEKIEVVNETSETLDVIDETTETIENTEIL